MERSFFSYKMKLIIIVIIIIGIVVMALFFFAKRAKAKAGGGPGLFTSFCPETCQNNPSSPICEGLCTGMKL